MSDSSSTIAARLISMKKSFEAGNIGMSNYKEFLARLFNLAGSLAQNVATLEKEVELLKSNLNKETTNG